MQKTAVITGGNSGIGFVTARELLRLGWRVIITGHHEGALRAAAEELGGQGGDVAWRVGDFASFASVRALAQQLAAEPRIDVLINNVGIVLSRQQVSQDGNDMVLQVNHLSPFLLTLLLLDKLKASAPARIITLSSRMHGMAKNHGFDDFQFARKYNVRTSYPRTKLYNIMFTRELARRLAGTGVVANAAHPGLIRTRIGRSGGLRGIARGGWYVLLWMRARPLEEGSRVPLHLATAPELEGVTGKYFTASLQQAEPSALARDDTAAKRLWEMSERLTGLVRA